MGPLGFINASRKNERRFIGIMLFTNKFDANMDIYVKKIINENTGEGGIRQEYLLNAFNSFLSKEKKESFCKASTAFSELLYFNHYRFVDGYYVNDQCLYEFFKHQKCAYDDDFFNIALAFAVDSINIKRFFYSECPGLLDEYKLYKIYIKLRDTTLADEIVKYLIITFDKKNSLENINLTNKFLTVETLDEKLSKQILNSILNTYKKSWNINTPSNKRASIKKNISLPPSLKKDFLNFIERKINDKEGIPL